MFIKKYRLYPQITHAFIHTLSTVFGMDSVAKRGLFGISIVLLLLQIIYIYILYNI
jgi:hypothetical protein